MRSKARARDSRSRDRRRRRGSRDRDRDDNRGHDAQPPFSVFPRAERSEGSSSLRLTPNTQSRSRSYEPNQSRGYEQDLATWHNLHNAEAPPILRRVPLPAFHAEPPPVAMTIHPNRSVYNSISTASSSTTRRTGLLLQTGPIHQPFRTTPISSRTSSS